MTPLRTPRERAGGPTRRQLLLGGAAAGVGAAAALGIDRLVAPAPSASEAPPARGSDTRTISFHGPHQSGIATPPQAHAVFLALTLREGVDRADLRRLMRILSDDAARLMRGTAALADTEPELAAVPAALSITFGFGAHAIELAGGGRPSWAAPLPAFSVDRLDEAYSGGDLLVQICSDDPVTLAHALRMLTKDARRFARPAWQQRGFRRARGSESAGTTMRNLFGQVDGTSNPRPGTREFDRVVWRQDGWMAGGTVLVLRRIRMDLDGWDEIDRPGRELSVGRRLDTGAPLTGRREHDEPDLEAVDANGFFVIPSYAHVRRARSADPRQQIFRRAYNYDDAPEPGSSSNAGLLFAAYQADPLLQFVPMQERLAALDLLNTWTTPVGSAVFAIPPGCREGGYVGETLLDG